MTTTQEAPPAPAGRREWIGFGVLFLPAVLASLELTVTHLALPAIGRDLSASSAQLLWIVDVYAFLLAGALIPLGALGDRIGKRRLLLGGAAAFGVASALAAYAPSPGVLIVTRGLMGVAGSTLMPSVFALTATLFRDPRQRTTAIGLVIASVAGGTAIGPLVGGWLLEHFWWGSVFLLGVPVMALLLVLGPLLLPETRPEKGPGTGGRLDVAGAVLLLAAVLPAVYGLKQIASGRPDPVSVTAIVAGVVFAVAFVRRQRTAADPLVDLRLFASRAFSTAAGTLALGIFVLWGANYAIAQYLQLVSGLDPLEAGLWTAPSAGGVIAGSIVATRIAHRVGRGVVIGAGLALASLGFVLLTQVPPTGGLAVLVTGSVVVSAGLGPMMALATDVIVAAAPPGRVGVASAISSTAPQLGGALGVAILGSLITVVYRARMAGGGPAAARDTLGGAVTAAARLPAPESSGLLGTAREAFTAGFHLSAGVSAACMALLALMVVLLLRRL
ncbi:MFS transporter [Sphaerisporangium krabiense]|uniref:DHA2 family multidrug resistance protein-like MFS transporter n=1 Tax=Sphaerisporangium krabiense TaxID=763782 RepID=A0A7W8Z417_9ACTN|nr:MFS transporter [Sphaerisporangium krabiense]MBB5627078.1 DHA2 family multidrug resistance protein-like MFS transporter [Sphaerisporangium krabiense]